jgi:hypothetical protein
MTAKREATLYTLKERSKKCVKIIKWQIDQDD